MQSTNTGLNEMNGGLRASRQSPPDNSTKTVQNLPRMAYSNSPREDATRVPVEQNKWLEDIKQWEMNALSTLSGTKNLGPGVVAEGHLSSPWGVGSLDARSHDSNATHDLQKYTGPTKYKIQKSKREKYKRRGLNGVIEELSDVVNLDFKAPRLQLVKDTKVHTLEKAYVLMRTQRSMIDQLNHWIDVLGKKAYHLKADIANTKNDVRLLTQEKEIVEAKVKRYVDSFEKEQYKWLPIGLYNADAARKADSHRMEVEAAGVGLAAEAEAARMLAEAARKREEAYLSVYQQRAVHSGDVQSGDVQSGDVALRDAVDTVRKQRRAQNHQSSTRV